MILFVNKDLFFFPSIICAFSFSLSLFRGQLLELAVLNRVMRKHPRLFTFLGRSSLSPGSHDITCRLCVAVLKFISSLLLIITMFWQFWTCQWSSTIPQLFKFQTIAELLLGFINISESLEFTHLCWLSVSSCILRGSEEVPSHTLLRCPLHTHRDLAACLLWRMRL